MKNLLSIPLNKSNIKNTIIVLVLDISEPNTVIESLNFWITNIK